MIASLIFALFQILPDVVFVLAHMHQPLRHVCSMRVQEIAEFGARLRLRHSSGNIWYAARRNRGGGDEFLSCTRPVYEAIRHAVLR